MRQSKRTEILEAGKRVIQRDGVTTLTYESVAAEAGLTKGGLLYHFPSREDLMLALHQHMAATWEQCLEDEAGGASGELSAQQRFAAFARLSQNPDRAELLLMLEAAEDRQASPVWDEVYERWTPGAPAEGGSTAEFIARLAADGLWFYEALRTSPLDPAVRERVVEEIIELARRGDDA